MRLTTTSAVAAGSGLTDGDRMTDYVATRTGDRTTVRHEDRWTITHTAGARLADITDPNGNLIDAVQVGGASHATSTATADSLSAALAEYVIGLRLR